MNSLLQFLAQSFRPILRNQLFPALKEELGPLSDLQQPFVRALALLGLDDCTVTRLERQCSGTMDLDQMSAELPRVCDVGCKTNSKGSKYFWIGHKLHLGVADGQIPISVVLTSASLNDTQMAVPLALLTAQRVTSFASERLRSGSARLKDEFGGQFVRVRGCAKVMAHLMFGILALTADQINKHGDRCASSRRPPQPALIQ